MGSPVTQSSPVARARSRRGASESSSRAPRRPSPSPRRLLVRRVFAIAVGAALALFGLAVLERFVYAGKVMPGVAVEGVDIAAKDEDAAYADLSALASDLQTAPLRATIGGRAVVADSSLLELDVDEFAMLRNARRAARSDNPIEQTFGTVLRRFRSDEVALEVGYNQQGLEGVLDAWERETLDGRIEGDLRFEGTTVVEVAPEAGTGLLRDEARDALDRELRSPTRGTATLPVGEVEPRITNAAVARAAERARELLDDDHELVTDGATLVITPAQLVTAMGTQIDDRVLEVTIDADKLRAALGPSLASLEQAPVDAGFEVTAAGSVQVIPSVDGHQVDMEAVVEALLRDETRITAPLKLTPPERDTAWAESLGIKEQVSTFSTNHKSGEERVKNIHRAADLMNNTIVEPGETFSLNDAIGPRTQERGFVVAPVFYGEFTEDFGGGVSQLATTTFNAVFWGGYEDVYHKPHTIYITRYPMGREATVNYPTVDLKFKNDSPAGVLIRTSYSSSSITVTFYGDKQGKKISEVDRKILAERPIDELFYDCPGPVGLDKANVCATLPVGTNKRAEEGHAGIDVEFYRLIEQPGEEPVRERFFWRYKMTPNKTLVGTVAPTTTIPGGVSTTPVPATVPTPPTAAATTGPAPTVAAPGP